MLNDAETQSNIIQQYPTQWQCCQATHLSTAIASNFSAYLAQETSPEHSITDVYPVNNWNKETKYSEQLVKNPKRI